MRRESDTVAQIRDRILELDPADRRAVVRALADDRRDTGSSRPSERWDAYCEDHPYDPLCANVDQPGEPDAHLAGLSGGGGCTELWEYLSAYRNGE